MKKQSDAENLKASLESKLEIMSSMFLRTMGEMEEERFCLLFSLLEKRGYLLPLKGFHPLPKHISSTAIHFL